MLKKREIINKEKKDVIESVLVKDSSFFVDGGCKLGVKIYFSGIPINNLPGQIKDLSFIYNN
jgi:hypothetical protein